MPDATPRPTLEVLSRALRRRPATAEPVSRRGENGAALVLSANPHPPRVTDPRSFATRPPAAGSPPLRLLWQVVRASFLLLALAAFAVATHIAAGPGGIAVRPPTLVPPDQPTATSVIAASAIARDLAPHHLVLVVDDPDLAAALNRRLAAGALIPGEYGAPAHPATFEVITAPPGDTLRALRLGLGEYQRQCVAASCPAITILDLRHAP
jgi:CTP:molybdopterin cytidylyltransferase MocA